MKLLIDIGNSRLKWATYAQGAFGQRGAVSRREATAHRVFVDAFRPLPKPQAILVANVGGRSMAAHVAEACMELWSLVPEPAAVERQRLGVTNAYTDFTQLGVDRWLALLAAWATHGQPACIVDCGTAMTIDGLDRQGQHLGGLIVPGIDLMERLLIERTQGISLGGAGVPSADFGRSTEECVRNGAAVALAALVDRAAGWMSAKHGNDLRRVITGGSADRVLPLLQHPFELDPDLVFRGLALLAEGR